jgi:hypothetical protein
LAAGALCAVELDCAKADEVANVSMKMNKTENALRMNVPLNLEMLLRLGNVALYDRDREDFPPGKEKGLLPSA